MLWWLDRCAVCYLCWYLQNQKQTKPTMQCVGAVGKSSQSNFIFEMHINCNRVSKHTTRTWPVMAITLMWEHAMTENSSNERVKINNKIGPGAEGERGQRNEEGPKRVALVCEQWCPLFLRVGVLVWIGGPGAVIAVWNVSLVRGCALTTGCHCPCGLQRQNSGVTNHN